MAEHKEIRTIMHKATELAVDEEIKPLVDFLNNFEKVETLWCCQGNDSVTETAFLNRSYVIFKCNDIEALTAISIMCHLFEAEIKKKVKFYVNFDHIVEPLRYELEFENKSQMLKFTKIAIRNKFKVL